MGSECWLVDETEEVKFYLGKVGSEDLFKGDASSLQKFISVLRDDVQNLQYELRENQEQVDFWETPISEITASQFDFLLRCRDVIEKMYWPDRNWLPYLYFIEEIRANDHEWDFYSEYDEKKIEEYSDYTELCNHLKED